MAINPHTSSRTEDIVTHSGLELGLKEGSPNVSKVEALTEPMREKG